METKTCERCGDPFSVKRYMAAKAKYCSRGCFRAVQCEGNADRSCLHCGAGFVAKPSEGERKYCGEGCRREAQSVRRACMNCGAHYSRPASDAGTNKYCSLACYREVASPVERTHRTCQHCERAFRRSPSDAAKYCSRACADTAAGPVLAGEGLRLCKGCGEAKPPGAFYARPVGTCRVCVGDRVKRRRKEKPEAKRAEDRRRRARKAGAAGAHTAAQAAARVAYFGGRCWMCGEAGGTIDHVKPLSKGGSDWAANLRPACGSCNSKKRDSWHGVRGVRAGARAGTG